MTFDEQFVTLKANVRPAMLADLAEQLGVSPQSLDRIGIGWYPLMACWVFAERDETGRVIGLVRRFKDGKKFCVDGSKRGLTYPIAEENTDAYSAGKHNWIKTEDAGVTCPICGHGDWCLVSSEDPSDPKAVICGRKAEGATKPLGEAGYLHIRKAEGRVGKAGTGLLPASDLPVLIVEGQSDVAAALDLGFVAVGKPSASGGLKMLGGLLTGRAVIVIGENDSGAGKVGMEKTFEALRPVVTDLVRFLPPDDIKDLREWKRRGVTQNDLMILARKGDREPSTDILDDKGPLPVAELWLNTAQSHEGIPILRLYKGDWCRWDGHSYVMVDEDADVRGGLYWFLKDKKYRDYGSKGEVTIKPYEPNRSKITDILDALNMRCPVRGDPPCWLTDDVLQADSILTFQNGLVDAAGWSDASKPILLPHTPNYFCLSSLPYAYDESTQCPTWTKFLSQVFPNDQESVDLLQEWFGYNLIPNTSYEKLMLMVGRPGAGKGTVIEALRAMLGASQVASTNLDDITVQFGLFHLIGKLAVVFPDAHTTRKGDAMKSLEVLKAISGRDYVGIHKKYSNKVEYQRLTCRITVSVNDLPDLPDHARTLERRLLLLYFGESFAGREDITLKDRVAAEAQGIAMWALAGLRRLQRNGKFTTPQSSSRITESFRNQISPITEFTEECCDFGATPQHWTIKQMLYEAWTGWAKAQGLGPSLVYSTRAKFDQRFLALCPGVLPNRRLLRGVQTACYNGVRLTDAAAASYIQRS